MSLHSTLGNTSNMLAGWWFITCQQQLLSVPQGNHIPFGEMGDLPIADELLEQAEYFTDYQGEPCYCLELTEVRDIGLGEWSSLYELLSVLPEDFFNLAGKAMQRHLFLRTHQFCGQCGHSMDVVDWELAVQCPSCGFRAYPRISPSIIVGIRRDNQILLACHKRQRATTDPIYTVIAGFVEGGETLEQCVEREVAEEVGLKVTNVRYIASQPWPFPHSMMVAYLADYAGGELRLQRSELTAADWYDIDQLPRMPAHGTIARRLIEQLRDEIHLDSTSRRVRK